MPSKGVNTYYARHWSRETFYSCLLGTGRWVSVGKGGAIKIEISSITCKIRSIGGGARDFPAPEMGARFIAMVSIRRVRN